MLRALKKGNPRAFDVLAVRAYGKVKEHIELSVSPGVAERLEAARRRLEEMPDPELNDGRPVLQLQLQRPAADADGATLRD
jgi:hypothetical protein